MNGEPMVEVRRAATESCRRVTCRCSEPLYCGGWKTCADRELPVREWCFPCLARAVVNEPPNTWLILASLRLANARAVVNERGEG